MKKKVLILIGIISCLIFSVLPGCGCGQQQEVMETVPTVEETEIESESISIEETTEEETIPEETTMEQTESIEEQTETVMETEGLDIQDMSAVMYTTANVVLRQEPSTESEKLRTVSAGEEVEVTGQTVDGLWFRVEDTEKGTGYISGEYLSSEKPVIQEPVQQETVVNESATSEDNLPEAPAPDNPGAWDSLGEPEYTDGSEFAPTLGDGSNLGEGTLSGGDTGLTWN